MHGFERAQERIVRLCSFVDYKFLLMRQGSSDLAHQSNS
jgi:hypothetical protein